jgi:thiol:disulfide interchange protein DsbA
MTMKRRVFSVSVAASGLTLVSGGAARAQGNPVEGVQYVKLAQPAPVSLQSPDKKVEVVEFFWYECPHCNAFEPVLEPWARQLPPDVAFHRVPVGFTARHQVAQRAYYALEEMGQLEALHSRVFAAIHVQRQRLLSDQAYAEWVGKQGVDAEKFATTMKSFSVATKARRATQLSEAYKIDGVPALGVQGRFYTSGATSDTAPTRTTGEPANS